MYLLKVGFNSEIDRDHLGSYFLNEQPRYPLFVISLPFCFEQKAGHVGNVNKRWRDSRQAGIHIYDALLKIK